MHTVQSWDMNFIANTITNGSRKPANPVWQVYNGETIKLKVGDTLKVNAQRIGYIAHEISYVNGHLVFGQ